MNIWRLIAANRWCFARKKITDITLRKILLLSDPEEQGLYLSRFQETIVDAALTAKVFKRIYWRRSKNGEIRIVAADNGNEEGIG